MSSPLKFIVSAPGKVILFGEHSVVYGKPALAASINKRTVLTFETTDSDLIEINLCNLNFALSIPLNLIQYLCGKSIILLPYDYEKLLQMSENIIKTLEKNVNFNSQQRMSVLCILYLLHNISRTMQVPVRSFKITVSSDLIIGAGTGSSASYSVCVAAALYHFFRIINTNSNYKEKLYSLFTSEDKKIINEYAFACEQVIHGKASGIDNFVCTYGSIAEFSNEEGTGNKNFNLLENSVQLRIFLINTGMDRSTAKMVKIVSELYSRNNNVIDIILNAMAEISKKASLFLIQLKNYENENDHKNLKNVFGQLEDLVSINHGLLASLTISSKELDSIVNITKKYDLHSKLTGAGGGGFAFTLIPPYIPEEIVQNCKKELIYSGYTIDDITIGDIGVDIKIF